MIAWVRLHADPGRTEIILTEKPGVKMIWRCGNEGLMIFWHASLVGWIVCWKQSVEKTMKFSSAYEANVSDLYGPIWYLWTWLPQGVSVRRILDCKLVAEDVVVGHWVSQESRNLSTPWREGIVEDVMAYSRVKRLEICPTCEAVLSTQVFNQLISSYAPQQAPDPSR
jgi:hypothetical protein